MTQNNPNLPGYRDKKRNICNFTVRVTGSRNYAKAEGSFPYPVTRRYEYSRPYVAIKGATSFS